MKLVVAGRRFPGLVSSARNGGNSVAQARRPDLEHPDRRRHIPQPPRPQIHQINSAEQTRRRLGQQDLTAVPGGHHPRRTVEHRTEVVPVPQFGLAGRQPHPHRQLQRPLRGHRGIHRGPRRRERGAHPVTGVLEQPSRRAPRSPRATPRHGRPAPPASPSASASHRRVEPSTSVNRNVTTPEGAAARSADTPAESHNRHAPTWHIGGIRPRHPRPEARRSALPAGRTAAGDNAHVGWPAVTRC